MNQLLALRFELVTLAGDCFQIPLDQSITIGRGLNAHLRFGDPYISRHHLLVTWSEQGVLVTDLGSTCGTFINGERLVAGVPSLVTCDQILRVGTTTLHIRAGEPLERSEGDMNAATSAQLPILTRYHIPPSVAAAKTRRLECEQDPGTDPRARGEN